MDEQDLTPLERKIAVDIDRVTEALRPAVEQMQKFGEALAHLLPEPFVARAMRELEEMRERKP